ncbi:MAG: transcription termination/antitermination factor NusG [Oscillospiraceae bacterium]|nr:transcription termination/antitermination factor NusG [Oscillospiraceae bacterium]
MADEAKWYILHTYSGYENKVANDLMKVVENRNKQDLIQNVLIPTVKNTVTKDNGTTEEIDEKLYPGYVFVKMIKTNESWQMCRTIRGVTGFVGPESKPTPLSEAEVMRLEKTAPAKTEVAFEVGDSVVIKEGVLENFEGTISEIDTEAKTAVVNITNMFGESTPTTVELSAIRKNS